MQPSSRIIRFGLVGIINTLTDVALYTSLYTAGLAILPANIISTSSGLTVSLLLNSRFTFRDRQITKQRTALYIVITVIGLWLLQPVVIYILSQLDNTLAYSRLLSSVIGHQDIIQSLLPKLGATAVSLIWNYLWYNKVIYK